MPKFFNLTSSSVLFSVKQGTVWRSVSLPALGSISTTGTELDSRGQLLLEQGKIAQYDGQVPTSGASRQALSAVDVERLLERMIAYPVVVGNAGARLALTTAQAAGRIVVQADTNTSWLLTAGGSPSSNGAWVQLGFSSVNIASVTGLTQALTAIQNSSGVSAYQVAVANGFVGSQEAWLASLIGPQGSAGHSAYQVAVANGFVGSSVAWLASLVGPTGDTGIESGTTPPTNPDVLWLDPSEPTDVASAAALAAEIARAEAAEATKADKVPTIYAAGNLTGTVTLDYANGDYQSGNLTGNVTLNAPSNGAVGKKLELWLTPSGADRTLDFNVAVKRPSDSALTLPKTLTSGKQYIVLLKHNGTAWLLTSLVGGY